MSRLAYLLSVMGLWLAVLLAQPLLLGLQDFLESGRLLDMLWRSEYAHYGAAVDAAIDQQRHPWTRSAAFGALVLSLFGAFLILSARRLRDLGRPGRYASIALVPFVGAQALFAVLILLPGDAGENAYGPSHQARADDEAARGFRPARSA